MGFAQYLPDEQGLQTKEQFLDQITSILAGRIAEDVFFGEITTGAADDLDKAYKIAHNLVTKLGMSEMGSVSLNENQYGQIQYSDDLKNKVDAQCAKIIEEQTKICEQMVQKYKASIKQMSDELLKKKSLNLRDIINILGERPFKAK